MAGKRYPNPNPSGLCMCGCGEKTSLATTTEGPQRVAGYPCRYVPGHSTKVAPLGTTHPGPHGYVMVKVGKDHPLANSRGWALEHRVVASDMIGRPLEPEEISHHINGVRDDNSRGNIEVLTQNLHPPGHNKGGNCMDTDTLGKMWRSIVTDDEKLFPDTTGCPDLPSGIKDVTYWTVCIAGETAEMLNLIKKRWRNGHWDPDDLEVTREMVSESIDVLIYLVELFEELGVDEQFLLDEFFAKKYELHQRWQMNGNVCKCDECQRFEMQDITRAFTIFEKVQAKKKRG